MDKFFEAWMCKEVFSKICAPKQIYRIKHNTTSHKKPNFVEWVCNIIWDLINHVQGIQQLPRGP